MRRISDVDDLPGELLDLIASARRPAVLSGAGISAESGIPTFREVQTGLWERFSAQDLATVEAFEADPALVWTWYRWRQALIDAVDPNPGHRALAEWQHRLAAAGGRLSISTQNVDDLHERAGAEVLGHLHGAIAAHRCADCGAPAQLPPPRYDGSVPPAESEDPPACESCDRGKLRPGVVWFGEMLPMEAFEAAAESVRSADLVLVVGTSGIVQPAASLPLLALERGTALVEVNPEDTELTEVMDFAVRGGSGEMLPHLLTAAGVLEDPQDGH
ncbi:SIR2 family NAD-dependent protein deacylase [Nesterenkonia marinintestina]|uniref:SIR2 family NAD-dependent protein deacylase n=1 Tax=Nesterenkonia marinintestina TaxID=2979865 RepID=UPI0021BF5F9E|nr:NAD-dependent deacylase [Nesterenkonia sp. GX14115]